MMTSKLSLNAQEDFHEQEGGKLAQRTRRAKALRRVQGVLGESD